MSKEAADLKAMAKTYDRLPPRVQNAQSQIDAVGAIGNGAVGAKTATAPEPAAVAQ